MNWIPANAQNDTNMIGIIMTAGQGLRLRPHTNDRPKGMVEVAGRPMLEYVIAFARRVGVSRIIVIGGFEAHTVKKYLDEKEPNIQFVETDLRTKGNLGTLMTALPTIDDSMLLMNADHIYGLAIADKVSAQCHDITAFCDTDRTLGIDDMKVEAQNDAINTISKKLKKWTHGYVGMTYVDKTMLPQYKFTAEQMLNESDGTVAVEAILGNLAAQGHRVAIGDISHVGWLEIDTPEELATAETSIKENPTRFTAQ